MYVDYISSCCAANAEATKHEIRNVVKTGMAHIKGLRLCWSRSQRPRVLRHEMSLPVLTLGSWVSIPLEAWMSVRVSSAFVLSCVGSGLVTGLITCPSNTANCL
jgi:hypothetical protein